MKIHEAHIGAIVYDAIATDREPETAVKFRIGYISGLELNATHETIARIVWDNSPPTTMHFANIRLLTEASYERIVKLRMARDRYHERG